MLSDLSLKTQLFTYCYVGTFAAKTRLMIYKLEKGST